jgi:hypothetical protein
MREICTSGSVGAPDPRRGDPTCAKQAWMGRMIAYDLKSRFVPQWPKATWQRCSDQPVPSVAWLAVTLAAKRTQGVRSRVRQPRKENHRESGARILRRPQHRIPLRRGIVDLTGVRDHGARTKGHPGTWEVCRFHRNAGGSPAEQAQARDRARDRREQTYESPMVTAARRKPSTCGTSEQKSELRVVPVKWGNRPEGPHGGKATGAGHGNHWRER